MSQVWTQVKIAYRRYVRAVFHKHALVANVTSSGVLMWLGDLVQQMLERRDGDNRPIDRKRLARMFAVGLFEGPPHHFYYTRLDQLLPGRDLLTVSKKILLDQVVASPMFISIFFFGNGLMEGKRMEATARELRDKIWTVYIADWLVWPPSQFLNFYLVPPVYRVLYINGVTVLYNVFLSYVKHRDYPKSSKPTV